MGQVLIEFQPTCLVSNYPEDKCPGEHAEHVSGIEDAEEMVVITGEPHVCCEGGAHDCPVKDEVVMPTTKRVLPKWGNMTNMFNIKSF